LFPLSSGCHIAEQSCPRRAPPRPALTPMLKQTPHQQAMAQMEVVVEMSRSIPAAGSGSARRWTGSGNRCSGSPGSLPRSRGRTRGGWRTRSRWGWRSRWCPCSTTSRRCSAASGSPRSGPCSPSSSSREYTVGTYVGPDYWAISTVAGIKLICANVLVILRLADRRRLRILDLFNFYTPDLCVLCMPTTTCADVLNVSIWLCTRIMQNYMQVARWVKG
jgi:hypothetical protein